jgi:hypothetical protein
MSKQLQITTRFAYYHLPIHCGFCGHKVIDDEDSGSTGPSPCKHTLFVAHSEGIEHLAERTKAQLSEKGYVIEGDDLLEIYLTPDEDESIDPDELSKLLEFEDGMVVEAQVGPPSGMITYVGFAPVEGE